MQLSTFLSKTWSRSRGLLHQSRRVEIDAQVRWFMRVLDKWNADKNPFCFEPANEPVEAGFSLPILLFVRRPISSRN